MTNEELATPPTALEVAELLAAASRPDYQLSKQGLNILRRLAFDRDKLQMVSDEISEVLESLPPVVQETVALSLQRRCWTICRADR